MLAPERDTGIFLAAECRQALYREHAVLRLLVPHRPGLVTPIVVLTLRGTKGVPRKGV